MLNFEMYYVLTWNFLYLDLNCRCECALSITYCMTVSILFVQKKVIK